MKVLVTGSAGFIGSHFVRSLLVGEHPGLAGADDHCRGIALIATGGRDGEIHHIGGGTELTERLVAAVGADMSMAERVPDRRGHDRRYSVDWSRSATSSGTPRGSRLARASTPRWPGTAPAATGGSRGRRAPRVSDPASGRC